MVWLLLGVCCLISAHAQTNAQPGLDYKEVYDLIKSQLPQLDEPTLSDTAARGLIRGLKPQVQLVTEDTPAQPSQETNAIQKTIVFDQAFAYLYLGRIGDETQVTDPDPGRFFSATTNKCPDYLER